MDRKPADQKRGNMEKHMKKLWITYLSVTIFVMGIFVSVSAAENAADTYSYTLDSSHEVDGRQGIAWENGLYYVSGSTSLSVYDAKWDLIGSKTAPFGEFDAEVNHIGDIDVYDGEIYAGVEYFMDGAATNIQMAVYDAGTLELVRTYMFDPESGQTEVSGIAVDPDHGSMWMCS